MKKSSLALFLIAVLLIFLCVFIVRSEITRAKVDILEKMIEDKQRLNQVQIDDLKDYVERMIDRS